MSVDFQTYYDPFLPSATEIKFKSFIDDAELFNEKNYLPWINSNYIEGTNG